MPSTKRKLFDWANKVDPETGEATRFCTRCQEYLVLDSFHPSTLKCGGMRCKTHSNELKRAQKRRWSTKERGASRSVERVRSNLNQWISRHHINSPKWTDADVERALRRHGVDLAAETRCVRLRPQDPTLPFSVENSTVHFRKLSIYTQSRPQSL